jgi:phage gp16-like protein
MPTNDDPLQRKADLAKIHIGRKFVFGDHEDDYRAMLRRVTGKDSSAKMSSSEMETVIAELVRLGWTPANETRQRHAQNRAFWAVVNGASADKQPLLKKAAMMLLETGRDWSYAIGIAKQQFQLDELSSITFLTPAQLQKVVQALTVDQRRRKRRK